MKNVSILIPYKPDYGQRDESFRWIRKYYKAFMPEAELCIGECDTELYKQK